MALNPKCIADAVVYALHTNAPLVQAMAGDKTRIYSFYSIYGLDPTTKLEEYIQRSPSVLVTWDRTQMGNYDGSCMWKHHFVALVRMQNAQTQTNPITYPDLFDIICNAPVNGLVNIRNTSLLPNLDPIEDLDFQMVADADGQDFMMVKFTCPEIGDESSFTPYPLS
jgi:hypothetical protein